MREKLLEHALELAAAAAKMTESQFRKHVNALVRRIQADDGESVYERQLRATRLRWWTNHATGMGHLAGEFDPVTFAMLQRRIHDTVGTLFNETNPGHVSDGSVQETGPPPRVGAGGTGQG